MKIARLSGAQTNSLEAMGVDVSADVLVPFNRGPGTFTHCAHCYHQRYEIKDNQAKNICGNPIVKTGLMDCYYMTHDGENYEQIPE